VLREPGDGARAGSIKFTPDGQYAVFGSADRSVQVWDVEKARMIESLAGHRDEVGAIAIADDGGRMASGDNSGIINVWGAPGRAGYSRIDGVELGKRIGRPVFSPGGGHIATAAATGSGGGVVVWEAGSLEEFTRFESELYPVAFSPDGTVLVTLNQFPGITFWEVGSGRKLGELPVLDWFPEADLELSMAGTFLAVSDRRGRVGLYDLVAGERRDLEVDISPVDVMSFSPDGASLAIAESTGSIAVWDTASATRTTTFSGHSGRVNDLRFSPDGARLASAGEDGIIRLWSLGNGAAVGEFEGHQGIGSGISYFPDGTRIASAGSDGTIRFWDISASSEAATFRLDQSATFLEFSPDGRALVFGGTAADELFVLRAPDLAAVSGTGDSAGGGWPGLLAAARQSMASGESRGFVPPRAVEDPALIDLGPFYNSGLAASGGKDELANDFSDLSPGVHTLDGIRFDARGVIKLAARPSGRWPDSVLDIPVGRACRKLHFLHVPSRADQLPEGQELGRYVITFADGSEAERPIVLGRDVEDWWVAEKAGSGERGGPVPAWTGTTPMAAEKGYRVALFRSSWENPTPDVLVESVSFLSAEDAADFSILAITAE
ncbi:MAG: WD40 repeat domain-containing protein, partial [Verrucomicrobiales bacterium]